MSANEMKQVMQEYRRLRAIAPLGQLRSKKEYERAVKLLDAILDEIGDDERNPMAELADAIGVFVERYENEHVSLAAGNPSEVLKLLMSEHGLRQTDLPEIDTQGVVSELLAGKRDLNTRQIRKLANRFGVSAAVFV
jgi:HTH-type transcriptional regulator/antitoxin HigA